MGDKNKNKYKSNIKVLPTVSNNTTDDDMAYVELEGQRIYLKSIILCGENDSGKRVILTWNCTLDDMAAHLKTLEIAVDERIKQSLGYL